MSTIDAVPAEALRVPRTPLDLVLEGWRRHPLAVEAFWLLLLGVYLAVGIYREYAFGEATPGMLPGYVVSCAIAFLGVALRRPFPLAAAVLVPAAMLIEAATSQLVFTIVPALLVGYALARGATARVAIFGLAVMAVAILVGFKMSSDSVGIPGEPELISLLFAASLGLIARWRLERLRERDAKFRADLAQRALRRDLDRLAARVSTATELHDSVGHALTAVVSLARGALAALDDDPKAAREAVAMIEDTALVGLDRTRDVVRWLQDPDGQHAAVTGEDLDTLVARVRAAGREVRLDGASTTARHPLALAVLREGLTNALRYSEGPIGVSLEGATVRITSSLDGAPSAGAGTRQGLAFLEARVRAAGGEFQAGPEGENWVVRAVVPEEKP